MLKDFISFLTKTNALALAVGVIIGSASGKLVTSIVEGLLMPVVGLIMPAGDWRDAQLVLSQTTDSAGKITINAIKYGNLVGAAIDFVIIAFVVYLLTKLILPQAPPPAETQTCGECLETIPKAARKCRACTSAV